MKSHFQYLCGTLSLERIENSRGFPRPKIQGVYYVIFALYQSQSYIYVLYTYTVKGKRPQQDWLLYV
jgi:hypothetical protein